jgi:arylsulfatase A-like enzyme
MATFAGLAGTEPPAGVDSISFVPTLLGHGTQPRHEFLYWEFYESGVSQAVLLDGHWKGIRENKVTAPLKLYDLTNDLAEQTDVAAGNPAVAARIAGLMRTAHVDNEHWKIPGLTGP